MKFTLTILIMASIIFGIYKASDYLSAVQQEAEAAKPAEVKQQEAKDKNAYVGRDIRVYHDDKRHVTCWINDRGTSPSNGSISCIPDKQL